MGIINTENIVYPPKIAKNQKFLCNASEKFN